MTLDLGKPSGKGPPRLVEAVVERLTPQPFRECVTGDLSERYTSLGPYLTAAARTLFGLITGQSRRAFEPVLFAAEASALVVVFISTSAQGFQAAAFGFVLIALAILRVRDAYRYPRSPTAADACLDAIITSTWVLVAAGLMHLSGPSLEMEAGSLVRSVGISLVAIPLVRLVYRSISTDRAIPNSATGRAFRRRIVRTAHPQKRALAYGLWIFAGLGLIVISGSSVEIVSQLRYPLPALILVLALSGGSGGCRGRGRQGSWAVSGKVLFGLALVLPWPLTGTIAMEPWQGTLHAVALLTLICLRRSRTTPPAPV